VKRAKVKSSSQEPALLEEHPQLKLLGFAVRENFSEDRRVDRRWSGQAVSESSG